MAVAQACCATIRLTPAPCHMHADMPHAPAGAPAFNATFFCDSRATTCYSLTASAQAFSAAQANCVNLGGQLVVYSGTTAKAEQQMVGGGFWIGASSVVPP